MRRRPSARRRLALLPSAAACVACLSQAGFAEASSETTWQEHGLRHRRPEARPGGQRCLLIDTDFDLDDATALAYTCSVDAGDLRAVTVSGTGFALTAEQGADMVRRLLQLCGRGGHADGGIAVAAGRNTPLSNTTYAFPASWREQAQRYFERALPPLEARAPGVGLEAAGPDVGDAGHAPASASRAAQLVVQTAAACHQAGRPLDIVALGPLTNVAEAARAAPELLRRAVGDVYISGGNIDGKHGNDLDCGGSTNAAECNIFMDAVAAQEVLQAGLRVHMVDTAASKQLPLPRHLPVSLRHRVDPTSLAAPLQHLVIGALQVFVDTSDHTPYFYDPAAVVWRHQRVSARATYLREGRRAWALEFCKARRQLHVHVNLQRSPTYGTLVAGGANASLVDFCWAPNDELFLGAFLGPLFGHRRHEEWLEMLSGQGDAETDMPGPAVICLAASAAACALLAAVLLAPWALKRRRKEETTADVTRPGLGAPLLVA